MVQMFGWFSAEAVRASRRKRSVVWRIVGAVVRQELQRDRPAELDVFGLIHDAHAARAERFENAVVGDGFTNHGEN